MNSSDYQRCISACLDCVIACEACIAGCLKEKDVQMMTDCIRLDRDCADVCMTAAGWMARDSDYVRDICKLCAKICRDCAKECGKHDVAHCRKCAQACTACAEECEKMFA